MAEDNDNSQGGTPSNVFSLGSVQADPPADDQLIDQAVEKVSPEEIEADSGTQGQPVRNPVTPVMGSHAGLFRVDNETGNVTMTSDFTRQLLGRAVEQRGSEFVENGFDARVWSPVTNAFHPVKDYMPSDSPDRMIMEKVPHHPKLERLQAPDPEAIKQAILIIPQTLDMGQPGSQGNDQEHAPQTEQSGVAPESDTLETISNQPGANDSDNPHAEGLTPEQAAALAREKKAKEGLTDENGNPLDDDGAKKKEAPEPRNQFEAAAVAGAAFIGNTTWQILSVAGRALKTMAVEGWNAMEAMGSRLFGTNNWDYNASIRSQFSQEAANEQWFEARDSKEAKAESGTSVQVAQSANEASADNLLDNLENLRLSERIANPTAPETTENNNFVQGMEKLGTVPPKVDQDSEIDMAVSAFAGTGNMAERINRWAANQNTGYDQAKAHVADVKESVDQAIEGVAQAAGVERGAPAETVRAAMTGLDEGGKSNLSQAYERMQANVREIGEQSRQWISKPNSTFASLDSAQKSEIVDDLGSVFDPDDERSPFNKDKLLLEEMESEKGKLRETLDSVVDGLKSVLDRIKQALTVVGIYRETAESMSAEMEAEPQGPSMS